MNITQISLSWLPVTSDPEAVRTAAKLTQPGDETAKCLVHIYIDSCSGLQVPIFLMKLVHIAIYGRFCCTGTGTVLFVG
jgi:hypothetical protein